MIGMKLVEAVKPLTMPALVQQTIPIGVGLAVPLTFRDPILKALPSGVVSALGRFGVSAAEALVGVGEGLLSAYVLPENLRGAGFMAASATFALAGYDAIRALIGGGLRKEPAPVLETKPAEPVTRPISYL
jgi:hypothetical protein